jgi:hypothetical protein
MLVDTATPRRPGPSRALLAGFVAVVAAVGAGWWLGGVSRSPEPFDVDTAIVPVGNIRVEVASDWTPATPAPGPDAEGGRAFAPAAGLPARALLVSGPAAEPSLIPAALRDAMPDTLPAARRTKLAGVAAWTYGPVRSEERVMQVTVVPTTVGVLAVVCSSPPETWSVALGCASGVRGLSPVGGRTLEPSAEVAFRSRAGEVLRSLDRVRVSGREALASGPRRAAARRLAAAHGEAAAGLERTAVRGVTGETVVALRGAAQAYAAFGLAESRRGFMRRRAAVQRAEDRLAGTLARLRS